MSNQDPSCVFCGIVAGRIPATFVHEDADTVAFADLSPQAPTHILVIPREHVSGFQDLPPERAAALVRAVQETAERVGVASAYRLVTNQGAGAGQSVFHLHLHLLAGRKLQWPPG